MHDSRPKTNLMLRGFGRGNVIPELSETLGFGSYPNMLSNLLLQVIPFYSPHASGPLFELEQPHFAPRMKLQKNKSKHSVTLTNDRTHQPFVYQTPTEFHEGWPRHKQHRTNKQERTHHIRSLASKPRMDTASTYLVSPH